MTAAEYFYMVATRVAGRPISGLVSIVVAEASMHDALIVGGVTVCKGEQARNMWAMVPAEIHA